MGNAQQGAILDGDGKYSSKAWVINSTLVACVHDWHHP